MQNRASTAWPWKFCSWSRNKSTSLFRLFFPLFYSTKHIAVRKSPLTLVTRTNFSIWQELKLIFLFKMMPLMVPLWQKWNSPRNFLSRCKHPSKFRSSVPESVVSVTNRSKDICCLVSNNLCKSLSKPVGVALLIFSKHHQYSACMRPPLMKYIQHITLFLDWNTE